MGKRKASVFTVAESVSNWLDASCRIPEHIEVVKGKSIQVDTGLGIATSSVPTYLADVPAKANQLTPLLSPLAAGPDWGLASSPRDEAIADVAVPPQTSKENIPVGPTLEELDPGSEAAVEVFWALLAELGYEPL